MSGMMFLLTALAVTILAGAIIFGTRLVKLGDQRFIAEDVVRRGGQVEFSVRSPNALAGGYFARRPQGMRLYKVGYIDRHGSSRTAVAGVGYGSTVFWTRDVETAQGPARGFPVIVDAEPAMARRVDDDDDAAITTATRDLQTEINRLREENTALKIEVAGYRRARRL